MTAYSFPELLRALAAGSTDAFTQLFDRLHPKVLHSAYLLVRHKELAEDIVQDVFMKCWERREELPKVADFEAWLFVVTRNHALNTLKRIVNARGKIEDLKADLPAFVNDTDWRANIHIVEARIRSALTLLTEQQRKVFELSHFQGMNRTEIAQTLNLSVNTVKMHLVRALRIVRSQMSPNADLLVIFILLKKIF